MINEPNRQQPVRSKTPSMTWSAILICLGALLLGSNFGWINGDFWESIWRFWPVVLILWGIEVLVGQATGRRIAGSLPTLTAIGAVLALAWLFASAGSSITSWAEPWSRPVLTASGHVATQQKDFAGFDKIEISGPFKAEIVQSEVFDVSITGDDNFLDRVLASHDGDRLRISFQHSPFLWAGPDLKIRITMPNLDLVKLSGAAKANVSGFRSTTELEVELTGASSLAGQIEAGDTKIAVSGASKVELSGSGNKADFLASGASSLSLGGFQVKDAKVSMSGASKATVNAIGRLDADAHGASRLQYSGNPTLGRVVSEGASSVAPR